MKSFLIVIFLISFPIVNTFASEEAGFLKGLSQDLDLPKLNKKSLKDKSTKANAAFIFTVLQNTRELKIHQMNGETQNRVYVRDEGQEAVFKFKLDEAGNPIDGTGSLVKDCFNQGSYNYYHYYKQPLGHFSADILPWLVWGNCENDPSTLDQRIEAYMLDFRDGFDRAHESGGGYYLPKKFKFKKIGQSESVGFFLKALATQKYNLNNFVPNNLGDPKSQEEFYRALEKGIKALLGNA